MKVSQVQGRTFFWCTFHMWHSRSVYYDRVKKCTVGRRPPGTCYTPHLQPHSSPTPPLPEPTSAWIGSFEKAEGGSNPKVVYQKCWNSSTVLGWRTVAVAVVRHSPLVDICAANFWLLCRTVWVSNVDATVARQLKIDNIETFCLLQLSAASLSLLWARVCQECLEVAMRPVCVFGTLIVAESQRCWPLNDCCTLVWP